MPSGALMSILLLSPIYGFSAWLYYYLLRRANQWRQVDIFIMLGAGLLAAFAVIWVHGQNFSDGGTLWPPVLAAVAGYKAFISPLAIIAALRIARSRQPL